MGEIDPGEASLGVGNIHELNLRLAEVALNAREIGTKSYMLRAQHSAALRDDLIRLERWQQDRIDDVTEAISDLGLAPCFQAESAENIDYSNLAFHPALGSMSRDEITQRASGVVRKFAS